MNDIDQSQLFDAIMASAIDYAIFVLGRDGEIVTWNAGAHNIFGYSSQEILGRPMADLYTECDRVKGIPEADMAAARERGRGAQVRWHQRKDGSRFCADGVLQPMLGTDGTLTGFVKILRDATAAHDHAAEIERLARTDPLTGVANRTALAERFRDMTAAAIRHRQHLVVHVIDLDHFKQANDRHGHHVGDLLLKMVARRICHVVRDTDFVGRLGGDEFVVLQADAQLPDLGSTLARKLIEILTQSFSIEGRDVRVGASIGITVFPDDDADPEQLLRKADLALYKVKAEGRNGYRYFSKELEELASKRDGALAAVRRALANRHFSVVYQPQISTATGRVSAVEALLRCHAPALSQMPIADVVKLATQAGLMEELGLWVMASACRQTREWQQAGVTGLDVCVKLCATQVGDPALPARVAEIVDASGLDPGHLLLEFEQHDRLDPGAQQVIADIRALGVKVALDDFGTSLSSLRELTQLQVDEIKLDRSLLQNVPEVAQDCIVVSTILRLARGLHLSVVAEGVETTGQVRFFVREGCDLVQGYFFSPALPQQQMTAWLLERRNQNLLPSGIQGGQTQQSPPHTDVDAQGPAGNLSEFLSAHMQNILDEWDAYAERMAPVSDDKTLHELRDHVEQLVRKIAAHIDSLPPVPQEARSDHPDADSETDASPEFIKAAAKHGALRQEHRFTWLQLSAEFRALRATILRLWLAEMSKGPANLASVTRFNEAIDQALSESIVTYSGRSEEQHDLFIAILGHDLRGPLATMTMVGDLLCESGITPRRASDLGRALAMATKHMLRLVNDMLGLASTRLSRGMSIVCEPADAVEVCEAAIADAEAMYPDCEFVLSQQRAVRGSFDSVRLRQLITNLLINAAQYGARGYPVRVDAQGDAGTITLRVTNTGTPIPIESLECIFDRMRRLEDISTQGARSGTRTSLGLGLYIAREIALGHGGEITVASNKHDGTSFVVTLPRGEGHHEQADSRFLTYRERPSKPP